MGHNDRTKSDGGFADFLQELINGNHLDFSAKGITQLVIDKGREILTEKQEFVFKRDVMEIYTIERCSNCESDIPWPEMYFAINNDELCAHCRHTLGKMKSE